MRELKHYKLSLFLGSYREGKFPETFTEAHRVFLLAPITFLYSDLNIFSSLMNIVNSSQESNKQFSQELNTSIYVVYNYDQLS